MEDYNISYQIIIIACIGVSGSGVPQWDTLEDETGRLILHLYEFGVNRLHIKSKKWVRDIVPSPKEGVFPPLQLMNSTVCFYTSSHLHWLSIDEHKAGMDLLDGKKGKFRGAATTLLHHQHDLLQHLLSHPRA